MHYAEDHSIDGYLDMTFFDYYSISTDGSVLLVEKTGANVISHNESDSDLNYLLWNSKGQYVDDRLNHSSYIYRLDYLGRIINRYDSSGSIDALYEYDEDDHLIHAYSSNIKQYWEYQFEWSNGDLSIIYAHPRWLGVDNGKQCHFNVYLKYSEKTNPYNIDLTTTLVHEILTSFYTNWSDNLDNLGYFGSFSRHLPIEIYDGSEDFTYHLSYTDTKDGMKIHVKRTPFIEGRPDNLEEDYYLYKDTPQIREKLGLVQQPIQAY